MRISDLAVIAIFSVGVIGCAPPLASVKEGEQANFTRVEVFYGTDRSSSGSTEPAKRYGTGRGDLEYGIAQVSIPHTHKRGELEDPIWWLGEFKADPSKHVALLDAQPVPLSTFQGELRSRVAVPGKGNILVFIHGFNCSFEDAVRRTAQIAHDIPFPGVPVTYSWPSVASAGPIAYHTDEGNVKWTEAHLQAFLTNLKAAVGDGARIHLLAHSMGNRAMSEVLKSMARDDTARPFSQVVLAAPDIDKETFQQQIAPAVVRVATRTTLYASSQDRALMISEVISSYPRAGQSSPPLVFVSGLDTIDATGMDTGVLGHSYIGSKPLVLTDLYYLLRHNMTPAERNLLPQPPTGARYWQFQR